MNNKSLIKYPQKTYQSNHLVFKARSVDQAVDLFNLIVKNREHLKTWMPWVDATDKVDHTIQYIEMIMGSWDRGDTFDYSMFDNTTNKLIGSFGLHTINWEKKTCHLGYWIDHEYQGKGLISEAIQESLKWARDLGFRRICLTCDRKNTRSINSAIRNGFTKEAHLIDEVMDRGKWRDTLQFVRLLNDPIEGRITENLPEGYSIRLSSHEEFWKETGPLHRKVFDDKEIVLRAEDILSDEEKEKLRKLNQDVTPPFKLYYILYFKDEVVGWTWGIQEGRESFCMASSAVVPEHQGRGLYSRLLDIVLDKLVKMGFQKITSKHGILNNTIIALKLRKGFQITGTELNDFAGNLITMAYFINPIRKKVLLFRSGRIRPDDEIKKALKI